MTGWPLSVYCYKVGCHVLCLRLDIPVWQHMGHRTPATGRHRRDMTSEAPTKINFYHILSSFIKIYQKFIFYSLCYTLHSGDKDLKDNYPNFEVGLKCILMVFSYLLLCSYINENAM